jgi:hypothetical protein
MTIRLNGSTSGYTELDSAAVGGNNTLVLPTTNGTANQALVTDGSGTLSFADRGRMVLATAQASTSGTSIDFTGIPSWVDRITVMFNGVSANGSSPYEIRAGAGSIDSSGYIGAVQNFDASAISNSASFSTGYRLAGATGASVIVYGNAVLTHMGGNIWTFNSQLARTDAAFQFMASGLKAFSGTLDRVRITTVNGTDTFDAGSINILYEG